MSLCHSKTRSSKKCSKCPQQHLGKPARRPHRTSSVAGPNPTHQKPKKSRPNPWVNPTHGQLCNNKKTKSNVEKSIQPLRYATRLWKKNAMRMQSIAAFFTHCVSERLDTFKNTHGRFGSMRKEQVCRTKNWHSQKNSE